MSDDVGVEILRLIAIGRPLLEILDSICLQVEAMLEGCLCSIHVLSDGGKTVRLESGPGLPPEFRDYIADPATRKSCHPIESYAAEGRYSVTEDVPNHPLWLEHSHGRPDAGPVGTCWSLPVIGSNREPIALIFGLFRERVRISTASLPGIDALAYLCSIAIERDRRDAAVQASNERFGLLDLVSPTGKFQSSRTNGPITVSKRWREITGIFADQVTDESWLGIVHPDDGMRIRAGWREAIEKRTGFSGEYRLARSDNAVVWVRGQTTPTGESGYFGTFLDITAQKAAEEARRESEERFRTLANNISQLAWMADENGWVFWYNQRWYEYTGTTHGDVVGWGWQKVLHPIHVERVTHGMQHAWDTGQDWEDTFQLRGRDGNYRWFLSRALPIRDSEGKIRIWFGTNTDVTELRELQAALKHQNDALRKSNDELSRFAYIASHDLQEPLRTISNYTQLIQRRYGSVLDDNAATYFDHLISASRRLSSLISDLLVYSRSSSGEVPKFQQVDLESLVAQVIADCRSLLNLTGGSVTIDNLPTVLGDPTQLTQVFQNVISNSLKYRRQGVPPVVRIDSQLEGTHHVILIRDNGQGFDPEYSEHIFGIFKRLHGSEIAGTGMGLPICRTIVERHGGQIVAEGRPGQGATIRITLPAA